ncbi:hypothetical protein J5893_04900 [bacterium]|nr:hypothetical protein [bacterium]
MQEEMHYYCRNPHCPAQIKEKVLHFVSRDCLDISGIGESITEILMSQKLLQGIEDLYRLERPEAQIYLKKLPGFGEKKIFEILQGLEKSKTQPLWRILNGIGIPNIGTKLAKDLAQRLEEKKIKNLNEMIFWLTNEEFLLDIEGIGEKIQTSFSDFFANEEVKKMLEGLVRAGMKFEARSSV